MSVSACPVATIHAPAERVWHLLSQPDNYALWYDAQTLSITPEGPARPGQQVLAQTRELGRWWSIEIRVEMVDESKRQIRFTTALPFGITGHNYISCVPLDEDNCRVAFGWDFTFSPVWWGWILERFASKQIHGDVEESLTRLKRVAESRERMLN